MKITICGSTAFIDEMAELAKQLEKLGHEVKFPPVMVPGEDGNLIPTKQYYELKKLNPNDGKAWIWKKHSQRLRDHFDKVAWSECIVVANYDKNGIAGYIGPNSLMEMGLAFHLNKPIYLLNPIPEMSYKEEVLGVKPVVLNGKLELLSKF